MDGISVIVPLYNKANSVQKSVQSILAQGECPFEVIVVDDGSTDDSWQRVLEIDDPRIVVKRKANGGPSSARNVGVRLAKFDYVMFLDADDCLADKALITVFEKISFQGKDIDLCIGSFCCVDKYQQAKIERLPDRFASSTDLLINHFDARAIINVASSAFCVKKDFFWQAGGFAEDLFCWEITDFLTRAGLKFESCLVIQESISIVHKDDSNSQFRQTKEDPTQRFRYGLRILSYLDSIPDEAANRFYKELEYCAIAQVSSRKYDDFLFLSDRLLRLAANNKQFVPRKIIRIGGRLPKFALIILLKIFNR